MWRASPEFDSQSEMIRLYPVTAQTSDQQLDDVVAAIREFSLRAQALARAEAMGRSDGGRSYWPNYPVGLSAPTGLA